MSSRRLKSIAKKLTRMNMVVCAVSLLLACTGFVTYDFSSFRQVIVRNLSIQAQVAGSNSVSALTFDDPNAAERTLSSLRVAPSIVSACIYTADGKPFAIYRRDANASIPNEPPTLAGHEETYWYEHGNVLLLHTIVFQGKRAGFVFIESDLRAMTARVKSYIAIAVAVLAISLVVALFLSHFVRGSIAEPVIRLAEVSRQVSREKNFSLRAAPGKEEGELATLVETFNEMLGRIEERDRELQSARDNLERRVTERTAELAAANKELESFSYSVSHDLRAPLRSIDGFSLALAEDYADKLDESANNYLQRIRAATQRMGVLIDDLLNLSRVTRSEMQRQRVDLSGMARTVASELVKGDGERQVEWVIQEGVEGFGDARLLRIVMDNLLGNAWKYTSKHPAARIEFGYERSNGNSFYFVRDDGAGFDQAYSERLFGAFQRLHGMTDFPGTGVGLATVHRIIHRHGGRVWAKAAVEQGATFFFTL